MYYPHTLIAHHMRQFPILRQPWRRYRTTTDPVSRAFEKRQYRKAERAYRLMARSYQSAGRPDTIGRVGQVRSRDLGRPQITVRLPDLPSSLKVSVLGSGFCSPGSET